MGGGRKEDEEDWQGEEFLLLGEDFPSLTCFFFDSTQAGSPGGEMESATGTGWSLVSALMYPNRVRS